MSCPNCGSPVPQVRIADPEVEIQAMCEVHGGSGHLIIRREEGQIVLAGDGQRRCLCWHAIPDAAVTRLLGVLREWFV